MVVFSAALVTRGKTLVARQFVEMTRLRVERLISAFQKLVDIGRDHTFIETEIVRYVYQPMETLHLVLVTNKTSNILEDLETLRLLAKIVQDCCQTRVNEEIVLKHALDIVFAFGEVISFGHRESVTLSQVKTYTEMDSHEEKIMIMQEQAKINEARDMAKKKQKELQKHLADAAAGRAPSGTQMEGFGSSGTPSRPRNVGGSESMKVRPGEGIDMDCFNAGPAPEIATWTPSMSADTQATVMIKACPKKSMRLDKRKPTDILEGMAVSELALADEAVEGLHASAAPAINLLLDQIKVEIKEKITADLQVEGSLNGDVTCNGSFEVFILDPARAALACFKLSPFRQDFKYKTHPSLNKASQGQNVLEVRPGVSAFPRGACMRWQMKTDDDNFLPMTMSCWPTPTDEGTEIVFELELTDRAATLENVIVRFPVSTSSQPNIADVWPGEAAYRDGQVIWYIPLFDSSEGSGRLHFNANVDLASMLPASLVATQSSTRCPMDILECYHQGSKDAIRVACKRSVTYELTIGA